MSNLLTPEITEVELSFKEYLELKKNQLALEMAMGDRKVLNIPILFDKYDLEFLHQFPTTCPLTGTDLWTLALKWRYGEGLMQVSEVFSGLWMDRKNVNPDEVDMRDFPDERQVILYHWKSKTEKTAGDEDEGEEGESKSKKVRAFKFDFGKKKTGSLSLFYRLQDKGGLDMDLTDPIRKAAASEEELEDFMQKVISGQIKEPEARDDPAHFNTTTTIGQFVSMERNLRIWMLANQHGIIPTAEGTKQNVQLGKKGTQIFNLPSVKKTLPGYTVEVLYDIAQRGRQGASGPKYAFKVGKYPVKESEANLPVLGTGRFIMPITTDRTKALKVLLGYDKDASFAFVFKQPLIDPAPKNDPVTNQPVKPRSAESLQQLLSANMQTLNLSQVWLGEIISKVLRSPKIAELNVGNLILALNPKSAKASWGKKTAKLRTTIKGDKPEPSAELDMANLLTNFDILSDQDKTTLVTPVDSQKRVELLKAVKAQQNKLSDPEAEKEMEEAEDLAKWAVGFFQPQKGIARQGSQDWLREYGPEISNALQELLMLYTSKANRILGNEYTGWIQQLGDRMITQDELSVIIPHHEDFAQAMAYWVFRKDMNAVLQEIQEGKGVTQRGIRLMYAKLESMLPKAVDRYGGSQESLDRPAGGEEGEGETTIGDLQAQQGPLRRNVRKWGGMRGDVFTHKFDISFKKRFDKTDLAFLKVNRDAIEEKLKEIRPKFLADEIKNNTREGESISPELRNQLEKAAESKALKSLIPYIEQNFKLGGLPYKLKSIKTAPDLQAALERIRMTLGGEIVKTRTLNDLLDLSDYDPDDYGVDPEKKDEKENALKTFARTLNIGPAVEGEEQEDQEEGAEGYVLDWIDALAEQGFTAQKIESKIVPKLEWVKQIFYNAGVGKELMKTEWTKAIKEIQKELSQLSPTAIPEPQAQAQPAPAPAPAPAAPQRPTITASREGADRAFGIVKKVHDMLGSTTHKNAIVSAMRRDPRFVSNLQSQSNQAKILHPEVEQMMAAIKTVANEAGIRVENVELEVDPIQPIWGKMGEWTLYKQNIEEMSLPMGYPPYGNKIRKYLGKDANAWGVPNNSTGVSPDEGPIQGWVSKPKFKSLKEYLEEHKLDPYKDKLHERVKSYFQEKSQ